MIAYERANNNTQKFLLDPQPRTGVDQNGNTFVVPASVVAGERIAEDRSLSRANKETLWNIIDTSPILIVHATDTTPEVRIDDYFKQEFSNLELGRQFRIYQSDMTTMVKGWQDSVRFGQELDAANKAAQTELERSVAGYKCACYGSLRLHAQFLQTPKSCTDITYNGLTMNLIGGQVTFGEEPETFNGFGPDPVKISSATQGSGWCRPLITEENVAHKNLAGTTTATLLSPSGIVAQGQDNITDGNFGIALTAPAAGDYTLELNVTSQTPSATVVEIWGTVLSFSEVEKDIFNLPAALSTVADLITRLDVLSASGMGGLGPLKANVTALRAVLNDVIGRSPLTLPNVVAADLSDAERAAIDVMQNAQSAKSRADAAGHTTSLAALIQTAQNASSGTAGGFGAWVDGTNVLEMLDTHARGKALLTSIDLLDSNIDDNLTLINGSAAGLAELRSELFDIEWYEEQRYPDWTNYFDVYVTGTRNTTIKFSDILNINVPYCAFYDSTACWEGIGGQAGVYTYSAETNLTSFINRGTNLLQNLYAQTKIAIDANSITPGFLAAISGMKNLTREIDNKVGDISVVIGPLYGVYNEAYNFIDPGALGGNYVKALDRFALEKGFQAVRVLQGLSETLGEASNSSTDAVWTAQVNAAAEASVAGYTIDNGLADIEDVLSATAELHGPELEAHINATVDEAHTLLYKVVPAKRTVRTEIPIKVVKPVLNVSINPSVQCGNGEQQDYSLTARADITPLVIPVINSGHYEYYSFGRRRYVTVSVWTPFSIPWMNATRLTLAKLAPNCNVKELRWWNASSQTAVAEADPANAALVPGRGYYVLTANNCELRFDSSLFKPSGKIDLTAVNNDIVPSAGWLFVGSGGSKLPFDYDSLMYVQNRDKLEEFWPELNNNCSALRYEFYTDFVRDRGLANWTEIYEAIPMQDYPLSSTPVGQPAQWIEPGKAYWIKSSNRCMLKNMTGTFPTTTEDGDPHTIEYNISANVPTGWSWIDVSDDREVWLNDACDGSEPYICIGGKTGLRIFTIMPVNTGAFGDHTLRFNVTNTTYGISANASPRYYFYSPTVSISSTRTPSGAGLNYIINYTLNATNSAPTFCAGKTFYTAVDAPVKWTKTKSGAATIAPGATVPISATVKPRLDLALSGWMNIFVTSDASDLAKSDDSCVPGNALDIAADAAGKRLFRSTGSSIYEFNTSSCSSRGLIFSGPVRGIAYAAGKLFWVDDGAKNIKSRNLSTSFTTSIPGVTIAANTWYIAADDQAVYWVDNQTIKRATFDGTVTNIATNLDSPMGLDVDSQFVYWAETDHIRRVAKTGSCSGTGCAAVPIPENLVPNTLILDANARFHDVSTDGSRLFATVDADGEFDMLFTAQDSDNNKPVKMDSSKVIGIDLSTNTTVFAYMPAVYGGLPDAYTVVAGWMTSVTADASYVYWISYDTSDDYAVDRINKFTTFANVSEALVVPGRAPAIVSITPAQDSTPAGTIVRFNVTITNGNSADAPTVNFSFGIKDDIQMPADLQLCAKIEGSDEYDCEGDSWGGSRETRSYIFKNNYADIRTPLIAPGKNATIPLYARPAANVTAGTQLEFNLTVQSFDHVMDGRANATLTVIPPGPPIVEMIEQTSECYADDTLLPDYRVTPTCSAEFTLQVENPETLGATYKINAAQVGVTDETAYWAIYVEPSELDVPGIGDYNTREVTLNIHPIYPYHAALGDYTFVVNVSNKKFPDKYAAIPVTITVTRDNGNEKCEGELGENSGNTQACAVNSDVFQCAFDGKCNRMTENGVTFGIKPVSNLSGFGACNYTDVSKNSDIQNCKNEFGAAQQRLLCSNTSETCSLACSENEGEYFLIANVSGVWYDSSVYGYTCPICIGKFHNAFVPTDNCIIMQAAPEDSNASFSEWLDNAREVQWIADGCDATNCEAAAANIVAHGETYEEQMSQLNPSECSGLRANARNFVSSSDAMLTALCMTGATGANLRLTAIDVTNTTYGQTASAAVVIENRANLSAYAKARCTYSESESGANEKISESSCMQINASSTERFDVPLPNTGVGEWDIICEAGWSTFDDCSVAVSVSQKSGTFVVTPPATRLTIVGYQIPNASVQDNQTHIRVDVKNNGIDANASVKCSVRDSQDMLREFESAIDFVGWNQTRHFFVYFTPDVPGTWAVEECSVYKRSAPELQDTAIIADGNFIIWPVCTSVCNGLGWDFGGCFASAANTIGEAGQYGCEPTEWCACGNVTITDKHCVRTGAVGANGTYTASITGTWQTGDSLRMDGYRFETESFSFSKQFYRGDYTINANVYKSFIRIYTKSIDVVCEEKALANVTAPANNATVSGLKQIRADFVDAEDTSLWIGETDVLWGDGEPLTFNWDTTEWPDGPYTLRARGCNEIGCTDHSIHVKVSNPATIPPTVGLTVAPTSIELGRTLTVSWSNTDATACTASGNWSGAKSTSGSETLTPNTNGTKTYTLTCSGAGGSTSSSVTATVYTPPQPITPAPTVNIGASPAAITLGQSSTLTWSSTNANSCSASGEWYNTKALSGTQSVMPGSVGTKTYTLNCTGTGGTTTNAVNVVVSSVQPICNNNGNCDATAGETLANCPNDCRITPPEITVTVPPNTSVVIPPGTNISIVPGQISATVPNGTGIIVTPPPGTNVTVPSGTTFPLSPGANVTVPPGPGLTVTLPAGTNITTSPSTVLPIVPGTVLPIPQNTLLPIPPGTIVPVQPGTVLPIPAGTILPIPPGTTVSIIIGNATVNLTVPAGANWTVVVPPGANWTVPAGSSLTIVPGTNWTVLAPPGASWTIPAGANLTVPPGTVLTIPSAISITIPPGTQLAIPPAAAPVTPVINAAAPVIPPTVTLPPSSAALVPQYGFMFDPMQSTSRVVAGQSVNYSFAIRNTGNTPDAFVLTEYLNKTWPMNVFLNEASLRRTVALAPNEQAVFRIEIRIPSTAQLGESAALTVEAKSFGSGVTKTSGPYSMSVASVPNSPPRITAAYIPFLIYRGDPILLFADIVDPDGDALVESAVCKTPSCGPDEQWCRLPVSGSSGTFNCTIAGILPGNYTYYIFVRDADGMTALTSARTFSVLERPLAHGERPNIGDTLSGAVVNASSRLPGQGYEYAIDDNPATYWVSQSMLPQWLQVQLQTTKWISGIGIYSDISSRPTAFDILIGDCTNFTNAYSETDAKYINGWYRAAFDAVLGRCIRLNVKATEDGSDYASIASFEVYEGQPPEGVPAICGNGVCDANEAVTNCPADCTPSIPGVPPSVPTPGIPIFVYVIVAGAAAAVVLLFWPRIALWWSYARA
jgi:hypothetical protein